MALRGSELRGVLDTWRGSTQEMKSGPKPLTPALRLLRGSRKRPRHAGLPVPRRKEGEPRLEEIPSWSARRDMAEVMSPEARRIWQQVIRPLDLAAWQWVPAVEYCTCLARWQQNVKVLQEEGDVLEDSLAGVPTGRKYAHPLVRIVKDLAKELSELRGALGLEQGALLPTGQLAAGKGPSGGKSGKAKERFFA